MFFLSDICNSDMIWRADSWLFIMAAGGDVSIYMPRKVILALASFIRSTLLYPEGRRYEAWWLTFDSTAFYEETTNIMIGGDNFVYTFNMKLSALDELASYLEDNCEDAEEEEEHAQV